MNVGLIWDFYTPAVEGQMTRDLIALQSETKVRAVCKDSAPERLLNALNISMGGKPENTKLWILYQTQAEQLRPPANAKEVIVRNLHMERATGNLDSTERSGPPLKEQGRIVAPTLTLNKPMPNHSGPTDPMVILLWG